MLSFTQINLHKATQATILLANGLAGCSQKVVMVTEPYTFNDKIAGLPKGMKVVYARAKTKGQAPRAGILSSEDVKLTAMESWCNKDCAVALAQIGGQQVVLVSLYMDINLAIQPQWLDELMNMIGRKGFPVIMGIDSNAHSTMFGPTNNARGGDLEDFILQYGLRIENVGASPTFETRRGDKIIGTHIDVTLSRDLGSPIRQWRVNREYNASDHNTILFEITATKAEPEMIRPWAKADWPTFPGWIYSYSGEITLGGGKTRGR